MKIIFDDNGSEETVESGLEFREAANKIRQIAQSYLGNGYDSHGNGFISADGTKKLYLEEE